MANPIISLPTGFSLVSATLAVTYGKSHKATRKTDVAGSPMTNKEGTKPAAFLNLTVRCDNDVTGWAGMDVPAGTTFTFRAVGVPDNWAS